MQEGPQKAIDHIASAHRAFRQVFLSLSSFINFFTKLNSKKAVLTSVNLRIEL